jgi:hypothetical protein
MEAIKRKMIEWGRGFSSIGSNIDMANRIHMAHSGKPKTAAELEQCVHRGNSTGLKVFVKF